MIAAIGLSIGLTRLFDSAWIGRRFGVSEADRRTLSLSLLRLAAVLSVAHVGIDAFDAVENGWSSSDGLETGGRSN